VVIDLRLPDMTGFELLAEIHKEHRPARHAIVVFTGRELTQRPKETELATKRRASCKGVKSPEAIAR